MISAMNVKHKILMFPWLAHGHITPLVKLSTKLIKRNFLVYICTTKVNIDYFKPKVESSQLIQFVELHLPSLPELPPKNHTTNGLPPHLHSKLKKALSMAKDDFYHILETLKPDLLIYDYIFTLDSSSLNVPTVQFHTASVASLCFFLFPLINPGQESPFPELSRIRFLTRNPSANPSPSPDSDFWPFELLERKSDAVLVNSFKNIEEKYFECYSGMMNEKVVPVGPLAQGLTPPKEGNKNDFVIEWIKNKEQDSVLYVSFGSECYFTKEETEAIAKGLELSSVNFIWVLRFPEGAKVSLEDALPEGFLKRVGDRGLVLEWAPQERILAHPNTGGFLSHCGWNSVLESMYFGLPIVAYPMHLDQPVNAKLVELNGFGIEVARNEDGKSQEEELARVIRQVMVEKNGETIRKRAKEFRDIIQQNNEKGKDIDEAVKELVQLLSVKDYILSG